MKVLQLSAISAAILLATTAQANSFIDDGSLNVELRNHFHERGKEQTVDASSSQWAQAIRADYSSGYFENIVGIDINAYYALKLGASNIDDPTGSALTPGVLPHDSKGDSDSFGKLGYALKFNLMDMGVLKYGRMELDTPLVNDSDSRALPSMTEAFYGDIAYQGFSGYGVWATKSSDRTSAGFDDFMTKDKNGKYNKEAVKALGGAYDFGNGLGLNAHYGMQTDFAKKYLTEATFSTEMNDIGIGVAAQYAQLNRDGAAKADTGDTKTSAWGLKAGFDVQQLSLGLAYTKVKDSDLGDYQFAWAGMNDDGSDINQSMDDTGYFGYNASQYSDFNKNAQKAIGLTAGYDFVGLVDGLSVDAAYVTSDFKKDGNTLDEKEYNIKVTYAFPQVEGLSAQLRYAHNTEEQADAKDAVVKDTRIIVKYNVAVF